MQQEFVEFEFSPVIVMMSSISWDIMPFGPLKVTDVSEEHVDLATRSKDKPGKQISRWSRHVPPKRLLIFNWIQIVLSHEV
jgi:hypothetical protein